MGVLLEFVVYVGDNRALMFINRVLFMGMSHRLPLRSMYTLHTYTVHTRVCVRWCVVCLCVCVCMCVCMCVHM